MFLFLTQKHDLGLDVLSDIGSDRQAVRSRLRPPDDLAAVYDKLGFDLQRVNDGHPRTLR
ncbi:hypothetical protein [Streptomyces sp. NPDC005423]|uniref:hypothetical protein n=1 Tax=Streptomyces sp. NPDC005423 TaxID=3155343 RepID=UPI0033B23155